MAPPGRVAEWAAELAKWGVFAVTDLTAAANRDSRLAAVEEVARGEAEVVLVSHALATRNTSSGGDLVATLQGMAWGGVVVDEVGSFHNVRAGGYKAAREYERCGWWVGVTSERLPSDVEAVWSMLSLVLRRPGDLPPRPDFLATYAPRVAAAAPAAAAAPRKFLAPFVIARSRPDDDAGGGVAAVAGVKRARSCDRADVAECASTPPTAPPSPPSMPVPPSLPVVPPPVLPPPVLPPLLPAAPVAPVPPVVDAVEASAPTHSQQNGGGVSLKRVKPLFDLDGDDDDDSLFPPAPTAAAEALVAKALPRRGRSLAAVARAPSGTPLASDFD